jgi:hypothetical protein
MLKFEYPGRQSDEMLTTISDLFDACGPADYLEALNDLMSEYVLNVTNSGTTGEHASDIVFKVNKIGVFLVKLNAEYEKLENTTTKQI